MSYYLPIKIDTRRIHICKLMSSEDVNPLEWPQNEAVFSFLIKSRTLFETYSEGSSVLVGDKGDKQKLDNYEIKMSEGDYDEKDRRVFYFDIVKKETKKQNNRKVVSKKEDADSKFPFCFDERMHSFYNSGYKVKFSDKNKRVCDAFVVCFRFWDDNNNEFSYRFVGNCVNPEGIIDLAIDFGSEASQIRYTTGSDTGDNAPIKILETMRNSFFPDYLDNKGTIGNRVFWQSDPDFFKSVYFMHKEPKETKYAECPNANGESTLIRALVDENERNEFYSSYIQLPNLKLLDLMESQSASSIGGGAQVKIKAGSDIMSRKDEDVFVDLGNTKFRDDVLHSILGQFLNCAVEGTILPGNDQYYLRLLMMVPNVYNQKKVFNIINWLYYDFEHLKQDKFKGVEVSVISESDASFLGALLKDEKKIQKTNDFYNSYFLIIDAGKGTTDVSILTPDGKTTSWNSIFRCGLPSSGQALTYAVYDAVFAFFKRKENINIDELVRKNNELVYLRNFMNALESVKIRISDLTEVEDDKINLFSKKINTLNDIANIIKNMIKEGKMIKGTSRLLKEKSLKMSEIVVGEIKRFMGERAPERSFGKIILTGRAFMLDIFKKVFLEKLKEKGLLVKENDDIICYSGNQLKLICLDGAVAIGPNYHINNDTELICRPMIKQNKRAAATKLGSFIQKRREQHKQGTNQDSFHGSEEEFIFKGQDTNGCTSIEVRMGLNTYSVPDVDHVYYVGEKILFIDNKGNVCNPSKSSTTLNREINKLIKETLFPFDERSIPDSEREHDIPAELLKFSQSQSGSSTEQTSDAPSTTDPQGGSQQQSTSSIETVDGILGSDGDF